MSPPVEAKCSPARSKVARPEVGGEKRPGDPGAFIGGRLLWELLMLFCRDGNGRGSWRLGMVREKPGGAEPVTGEPTELDPYESQLRREGMELSLGSVGLRPRGMVGGGESEFCEASIGW